MLFPRISLQFLAFPVFSRIGGNNSVFSSSLYHNFHSKFPLAECKQCPLRSIFDVRLNIKFTLSVFTTSWLQLVIRLCCENITESTKSQLSMCYTVLYSTSQLCRC